MSPADFTVTYSYDGNGNRISEFGLDITLGGTSFTQMTMPAAGGTQSLSASLTASATDGQGPYTYQWAPVSGFAFTVTNGATSAPTFSSVCAASPATGCDNVGTYKVTVTDALGRAGIVQVSIEQKYLTAVPGVVASVNSSPAQMTMPAGNPAESLQQTIAATVTNGQAPFTYRWALVSGTAMTVGNAAAAQTTLATQCSNSAAGCDVTAAYQVTVTDAYGRTATGQVGVEQKYLVAAPSVVVTNNGALMTMTMAPSYATQDLSTVVTANVTNGVAPFSYQWSYVSGAVMSFYGGGSTSQNAGLVGGCAAPATGCDYVTTYQVAVTDALGRTGVGQVSVEQRFYQALPPTVSVTSATVNGYSTGGTATYTGSSTATPSGGLAPYTYSWSPLTGAISGGIGEGNTTAATVTFSLTCAKNATCIKGGTTTVTVTDALGHSGTAQGGIGFDIEGGGNN